MSVTYHLPSSLNRKPHFHDSRLALEMEIYGESLQDLAVCALLHDNADGSGPFGKTWTEVYFVPLSKNSQLLNMDLFYRISF